MARTLFQRLKSSRNPSTLPDGRASSQELEQSILLNLQRVLNCRQDMAKACPDYGLMDLTGILHDLPEAERTAELAVQRCIERFEPRLSKVRVERIKDEYQPLTILFRISARISTDSRRSDISLTTAVAASGRVEVIGR